MTGPKNHHEQNRIVEGILRVGSFEGGGGGEVAGLWTKSPIRRLQTSPQEKLEEIWIVSAVLLPAPKMLQARKSLEEKWLHEEHVTPLNGGIGGMNYE